MGKRDLFNQWRAAFEAKDWERESALWQAMGHLPVTPEMQAAARALHSVPVEALNPGGAAIEAIAVTLHSVTGALAAGEAQ